MDAFSEILSGVKLNGAVFFSAEFSAPWGFSTPPPSVIADEFAPGTEHLVLYHFVIDGGAVVQLIDGPSVDLTAGEVVIFPHAHQHHMTQRPRFNSAISELRNFRQDQVARLESIAGWRRRHLAIRVRVDDLRSPSLPPCTDRASARF